jgi:hypothetical protein
MLAAGSRKSFWDVNWAYLGTAANILVSGTLHRLVPRLWAAPAMLVGTSWMLWKAHTSSMRGRLHDLAPDMPLSLGLCRKCYLSATADRLHAGGDQIQARTAVSVAASMKPACRPVGITSQVPSSVWIIDVHACRHILWCRQRDLGILVCAAVAAVALTMRTVATLVGA